MDNASTAVLIQFQICMNADAQRLGELATPLQKWKGKEEEYCVKVSKVASIFSEARKGKLLGGFALDT